MTDNLCLYDTFIQSKRPFVPLKDKHVTIYVCGVTVYDRCHLGHARTFVVFDLLNRYLKACGYQVTFVRNITDIDDKIIRRAAEEGCTLDELTQKNIDAMQADMDALQVLPADKTPKATDYIPAMLEMIQSLLDKGHAYIGEQGDVYFDVSSYAKYGQLSKKTLSDLRAGHRVDVVSDKKNDTDFVLWKTAKPEEPQWETPWQSSGRPGWHIECSAMAKSTLGSHIDIHGGGQDLCFPHHENERAQSECANQSLFVNTWMHVGFVTVDDEKMSKSLNNFVTIEALREKFHPEIIRYVLLASHYRSPLSFSWQACEQAKESLNRLYLALRDVTLSSVAPTFAKQSPWQTFLDAMDDDLNTPQALACCFDWAKQLQKARTDDVAADVQQWATLLKHALHHLGFSGDTTAWFQGQQADDGLSAQAIEAAIAEREQARAAGDWGKADDIRASLQAQGVTIEDSAQGTTWRYH